MSSHYADLKAIPQAEMLQSQVVAHIVQTLHGLLPRFSGRIGISFPAYGQNRTLGGIVRLFGSDTGLSDYALISRIEEVPSEKVYAHARFVRRQPKHGSDLRRAEKRMAAQGLPSEEIRWRLAAKAAKRSACTLPHIFLNSKSTRQRYLLAVDKKIAARTEGTFNSHGLSLGASVPLF